MGSSKLYLELLTSSLIMKFMGLIVFAMAACLLSFPTAAPAPSPTFLLDPLSTVAFTTAGGLVLTAASGSALTIPTSTLLLGKAVALKGALLAALAAEQK